MHKLERTIVYGALSGLAALALFQMPAHTATPLPADLGPADAVILSGKDGNLSLKNGAGRVQWGEQATAKAWSVAAVHSDKIMRALLASPRYRDELKSMEDEHKTRDDEFRKRFKDFSEKYKDVGRDSPNYEDAAKEYQQMMREAGEWRESFATRMAKLQSDQIEKSYRELTAAVDVVSERQKIDVVFRFVPTAAKFHVENPEEKKTEDEPGSEAGQLIDAMDQVRARTFLRYPEALDITAEVLKELNLKDE